MPTKKPDHEPLMTIAELAEYLSVPKQTLYNWRKHGRGPRGYKLPGGIRFRLSEVEAWLQQLKDPEPTAATMQHEWERFGRVGLGQHRRPR